tara:strand:- start:213 stop:488 length:276 start_codon:yes stop_codon:yes gene_type:complete
MARSGNIKQPTKVTLYMPREIVENGKKYAANAGGSLSQLVTDLVENKVGESFQHKITLNKETQLKIEKIAEERKLNIKELIPILLSENFGN